MALHFHAASKTDVGKQREQNEDACYFHVEEHDLYSAGLFIVADGMGGYHAGEVASKIAVDTISEMLQPVLGPASNQPTVRLKRGRGRGKGDQQPDAAPVRQEAAKTRPLPETAAAEESGADAGAADATGESAIHAPEAVAPEAAEEQRDSAVTQQLSESAVLEHFGEKLRAAVEESSEAIVKYGQQHAEARGLGSTLTAALVMGEQAYIANVGDSRTYLLRNGKLQRITHDHSLVARLVEAGQIDPDEVYDHPHRNLIYRSLGAGRAEVEVDLFTEQLQPNDVLLLCSDGLWEMVRDPQLESILTEVTDPVEACDLLIEQANENGGEDNITAVLLRCVES